jgi:hypothetical protein
MEVMKLPFYSRMLQIDCQEYERMRELKCFVSTLTAANSITTGIRQRIVMEN